MTPTRTLLSIAALLLVATTAGAQATVTCKDGTSSKGGQGACSGHGGIGAAAAKADAKMEKADAKADKKVAAAKADAKATKADAKADKKVADAKADARIEKADAKVAKAEGKGPATATCKDGTSSYAKNHSGACSGHGGVKVWLDGKK